MRTLSLLLFLVCTKAFAGVSVECQLTNGVYKNSPQTLTDLRFETVVDIFTLNNAKTLSMRLEGEQLRFTRIDMQTTRNTKLVYHLVKKNKVSRSIHMNIDRTPRQVSKDKEFYGNMIISEEISGDSNLRDVVLANKSVYNFYCRF